MPPPPIVVLQSPNGTAQWRVRTLRKEGKPIPRWVWVTGEEEAPVGVLAIDWERSENHRRVLKLATLTADREILLPPLRDVTIVRLLHGDLTLTGFETIGDHDYAQSWFCRLACEDSPHRGKPDEDFGATPPSTGSRNEGGV